MRIAKNIKGILVEIAPNLKGEYRCVDCNKVLVKKNNNPETRIREMYFAHSFNESCSGNVETYLHKIAKWLIENNNEINLPKTGKTRYVDSDIEKSLGSFTPDVLIHLDETKMVLLEIYVTNKKEEKERERFRQFGCPAFEIDLSNLSYDTPLEIIRFEVLDNTKNRSDLLEDTMKVRKEIELKNQENPWGLFALILGLVGLGYFVFKKPKINSSRY